jgi:hypothetical protein
MSLTVLDFLNAFKVGGMTAMGSKSVSSKSLNRSKAILTKVTPEGFWIGLQVMAKAPDLIAFNELPDDDKTLITEFLACCPHYPLKTNPILKVAAPKRLRG